MAGAMMAGNVTGGAAVMGLELRSFPGELAGVVSGWARTDEEALMWCGAIAAPVSAGQVSAWGGEDGVEQFGLYRGERLVAYGELWVDDGEAEVEVARLIVDPAAAFEPVGPDQAAAWNTGQPISYVWLSLAS
jgi:hypothetical protein